MLLRVNRARPGIFDESRMVPARHGMEINGERNRREHRTERVARAS